jgi:hypothetical protein
MRIRHTFTAAGAAVPNPHRSSGDDILISMPNEGAHVYVEDSSRLLTATSANKNDSANSIGWKF